MIVFEGGNVEGANCGLSPDRYHLLEGDSDNGSLKSVSLGIRCLQNAVISVISYSC